MAAKKKGCFSKLIRCFVIFLILIILLIAGVIWQINPIATKAINVGGPMVLGVPVSVEKVALNPSGSFELKNLYVGNPENYSTNMPMFAVEDIQVSLDIPSLFSDVIIIRKIQIDRPQVSYEVKNGKSNFDVLKERLAENQKKKPPKKDKDSPEKKVIIDELQLNKAEVTCNSTWTLGQTITFPIPSMTIRDIGKKDGGATFADATIEFVGGLGNTVINTGKAIGDGIGDAAKAIGEGVKDAGKAIGNGVKDATKAVSDEVKSIKKLF